jgi:tRNA (cytidine/uridine-2'-O-)-methyltransferase
VPFGDPAVLVFGRESVGLPGEVRARHAERCVRVPMVDREIRSLNVSTTVGIVLAEVARQRRRAP